MNAYPVMPGVPAAGHVTAAGGFWHPGPVDGCVKCEDRSRPPGAYRERWGIPEIMDWTGLSEDTIRSYRKEGRMPKEDGKQGQSPWWWAVTIRRWRGPGKQSAGRPPKAVG